MLSIRPIRFPRVPVAITLAGAGAAQATESQRLEEEAKRLRELEAAREEGHRMGFEEATSALNHQILEQRSDLAHLQETTFHAVAEQHGSLVAQISELLPELALEITRRVLAGFEPARETIERLTAETLAEIAPGSADVELWLCPRDLKLVKGLEKEFGQKYPGIQLRSDPELLPGDCRARSRFGTIDGTLATKLANVARSLT